MITISNIKQAMALECGFSNWYRCRPLTQSLARTLAVYRNRNEYDGTINQAMECLALAGYEIKARGKSCKP